MVTSGVAQHIRMAVQQAHATTWGTVQGLEDPFQTASGPKAGDPLGDIMSLAVFTWVLYATEARLVSAGLSMTLPVDPHTPCIVPCDRWADQSVVTAGSYLDDALHPLAEKPPKALVNKLSAQIWILVGHIC